MDIEKLHFVINQLAMQKAQLEVTLMEKEYEIQALRQENAKLLAEKAPPVEV